MGQPLLTVTGKMRSKRAQGGPNLQTPLPGMGNYTVEFSVSNRIIVPPGLLLGNITPVATINWALGGNQFVRKLSVFEGATITGCAEHVIVTVSDETGADGTPVTDYTVTIAVAAGVRGPTGLPPTYQTYITDNAGGVHYGVVQLAAGTSITIPVPSGAGVNSVMVTQFITPAATPGSPPNAVRQTSWGFATLKQYDPSLYDFVPLSASCKDIVLENNDTANDTIFSVTWGIDG